MAAASRWSSAVAVTAGDASPRPLRRRLDPTIGLATPTLARMADTARARPYRLPGSPRSATSPYSWCSWSSVGAATTRTPGWPASSGCWWPFAVGLARRVARHRAVARAAGVAARPCGVAGHRAASAWCCGSSVQGRDFSVAFTIVIPAVRRRGHARLAGGRPGGAAPSRRRCGRRLTTGRVRRAPETPGGGSGARSRWANGPAVGDGTGTLPRQAARRIGGPNLGTVSRSA